MTGSGTGGGPAADLGLGTAAAGAANGEPVTDLGPGTAGEPAAGPATDHGPGTAGKLATERGPGEGPRGARNLTRNTELAASLEVASSLWAKFMGLMGRPTLAQGAGLWLPESNGIHMMFMRFPIDAVFVGKPTTASDGARPVISLHPNLRAWTGLVPLVRGAHGVLELPTGTIEASATQIGDLITLD